MTENAIARANMRANAPRPTPVWTCTVVLNTDFAQRVLKRTWDRLKGDLYVLTVRTRSSGMDEAARAIEDMISEGFESARKDLEAELARSEALLDAVKLTDLPTYKGAQSLEVEYSTPRAKEFLHLLMQMDQLLMRYDALWLNAHIETQPRVQRSQNWQRRLIKIANRLRELGNRTRAGLTKEAERRAAKHNPGAHGAVHQDAQALAPSSVGDDADAPLLEEGVADGLYMEADDEPGLVVVNEAAEAANAETLLEAAVAATSPAEAQPPDQNSAADQVEEGAPVEPKRRRRSAVAATA